MADHQRRLHGLVAEYLSLSAEAEVEALVSRKDAEDPGYVEHVSAMIRAIQEDILQKLGTYATFPEQNEASSHRTEDTARVSERADVAEIPLSSSMQNGACEVDVSEEELHTLDREATEAVERVLRMREEIAGNTAALMRESFERTMPGVSLSGGVGDLPRISLLSDEDRGEASGVGASAADKDRVPSTPISEKRGRMMETATAMPALQQRFHAALERLQKVAAAAEADRAMVKPDIVEDAITYVVNGEEQVASRSTAVEEGPRDKAEGGNIVNPAKDVANHGKRKSSARLAALKDRKSRPY